MPYAPFPSSRTFAEDRDARQAASTLLGKLLGKLLFMHASLRKRLAKAPLGILVFSFSPCVPGHVKALQQVGIRQLLALTQVQVGALS